MNNTIPFHSATHAPQITVDVNILSILTLIMALREQISSGLHLPV